MGCVDPVIVPPSHDMFLEIAAELELVDGDLVTDGLVYVVVMRYEFYALCRLCAMIEEEKEELGEGNNKKRLS